MRSVDFNIISIEGKYIGQTEGEILNTTSLITARMVLATVHLLKRISHFHFVRQHLIFTGTSTGWPIYET